MGSIEKGIYAGATAEMVASLLAEFEGEMAERTDALTQMLARGEGLDESRAFLFDLSGQAANFGLVLLETVGRQGLNYLSAVTTLDKQTVDDLLVHLDIVTALIDGSRPIDGDPAELVRELPGRPAGSGIAIGSTEGRKIEVVLVMPLNAQTRFVEREVQACGYRVTIIGDTLRAIAHAVRTKPDMMIVSAVMQGLSGIDLAVALSSMPETRNIPVAVLTSLPDGDQHLALLPAEVSVIHKSDKFGDDLAKALQQHFLL